MWGGIRWRPTEGYFNKVRGFSRSVADTLNADAHVMRAVRSSGLDDFRVAAGSSSGCWIMGNVETTLSKPSWECYQSIARCLLAMPIPSEG